MKHLGPRFRISYHNGVSINCWYDMYRAVPNYTEHTDTWYTKVPSCTKYTGVEDVAAIEKTCGSEKISTKASICFNAILLAPSKLTLFELRSNDEPTSATSSIL
ncbi:hypothetical protein B296_00030619 [Ensete ventricosum]|uniref:Uncharacterized protein n=1 Tax=Ensete ventricosum TaxID=4639 RepID=A0A427AEE9_ENSVE|nr:hypothetical protein B296_00030619 [Ensete ventricosum]